MPSRFSSLLPAYEKKKELIFHLRNFKRFIGDQIEVTKSNSIPEKINGTKQKNQVKIENKGFSKRSK